MRFKIIPRKKVCSDAELIELYKSSNDSRYVGELFYRYTHLVSSLAYKYLKNNTETEDVVMEVFEILLKDLKEYEINNFSNWLYSVTKHHCLKKKRMPVSEDVDDYILKNNETSFMESGGELSLMSEELKEDQLKKLEEAVKQLSEEQQNCIQLFFLEERSYKEIADQTGYDINQVKSYIQNGKRNIKLYMLQ